MDDSAVPCLLSQACLQRAMYSWIQVCVCVCSLASVTVCVTSALGTITWGGLPFSWKDPWAPLFPCSSLRAPTVGYSTLHDWCCTGGRRWGRDKGRWFLVLSTLENVHLLMKQCPGLSLGSRTQEGRRPVWEDYQHFGNPEKCLQR
jgi:hypothetical protein